MDAPCCLRLKKTPKQQEKPHGDQKQREVEGYVSHTTPKSLQTPPQTLVEACGPCWTSDLKKIARIDESRLRQYPVGSFSNQYGCLIEEISSKRAKSLMSRDDFSDVLRSEENV